MTEYRGSSWSKWDMHVHTPESYTQQFGGDWDAYVNELKSKAVEHDIRVMGVTDYFSVEGYKRLCESYDPKNEPRLLLDNNGFLELIPCVELRLDEFTPNKNSINLHIFFDPKLQIDLIENNFLKKLMFRFRGTELHVDTESLIRVGASISEDNQFDANLNIVDIDEPRRKSYKSKALSSITLDWTTIDNQLKKIEEFLDDKSIYINQHYLVAIAGKGHGSLEELPWFIKDVASGVLSRPNEVKIDLLNRAAIVFTRTQKNIDFMSGKADGTPLKEFEEKFGNMKACIWGSDAHDASVLFHPSAGDTKDYTWIKADPTFEGLRQIILDPEFRVRIQESKPAEPIYRIEKISLQVPSQTAVKTGDQTADFCFSGSNINLHLSPYFNCFIGGRGVGKSTILNLLSSKYENNEKINNLEVIDGNGARVDLASCLTLDDGDSSASSIDFVSQNYIEELASNIKEFTRYIYGRVKKHGGRDLETLELSIRDLLVGIDDHIDTLLKAKKLENKIDELSRQISSKEKVVNSIGDQVYKDLTAEQHLKIQERSGIETSEKRFRELNTSVAELVIDHGPIDQEDLKNQFDAKYSEIISTLKGSIAPYKEEAGIVEVFAKDYEKLDELKTKIRQIGAQIKEFLSEKGVHQDNLEDLASANDEISILGSLKESSESDLARLNAKLEQALNLSIRDVFIAQLIEAIQIVNQDLTSIRSGSEEIDEISLEFIFDKESAALDFIEDLRLLLKKELTLGQLPDSNLLKRNLLADGFEMCSREQLIDNAENGDDSNKEGMKNLLNFISQKRSLEIIELMYIKRSSDMMSYMRIKVNYGGKPIEATSFGQRCSAALIILLALGNHPIVIDEPEAHLDSSLIANYLVNMLKIIRERRQIIFATHNANFVVNGDADLVYILENGNENKTKFHEATLENIDYRDKILKLEGGPAAFKQRDKRYSVR
jgi:exonuclease SbcC